MPRRNSPYDTRYERERRALLSHRPSCVLQLVCEGVLADSADHDPPLAMHRHVNGSGCCRLQPACLPCQKVQGKLVARALRLGLPWEPREAPAPSRSW